MKRFLAYGIVMLSVLASVTPGVAQDLFGITINGNVIRIDKTTGAGTLVGNSGFLANAAASDSSKRIFTMFDANELVLIDQDTGAGSVFLTLTPKPFTVRAMAFDSKDTLYVVLKGADFSAENLLATIDMGTGQFSVIGEMWLSGVQGLDFDANDNLFGLDVLLGGRLFSVDATTGATTLIGGGGISDDQTLQFDDCGTLFAARNNLLRLDPATGNATVVGPTGFSDIRGLAIGRTPLIGTCRLTALSAAKLWVGLKNSDDVGLRLDLKVEIFVNNASNSPIGTGQLDNVSGGSSGFNRALQYTIPLALIAGPVVLSEDDQLLLRVSVRRTCFGGGHNSGTARLWYNGKTIDSGANRGAGSRFGVSIDGTARNFYLRTGFALSTTAGSSGISIDRLVSSSAACPGRAFTLVGTWSATP